MDEIPIEELIQKHYGGMAELERMLRLGVDAHRRIAGSTERNNATEKQNDVAYWWVQKELPETIRDGDLLMTAALAMVRERIEKVDAARRPTKSIVDRFNDWEQDKILKRQWPHKVKPNLMPHGGDDDPRNAFKRRRSVK